MKTKSESEVTQSCLTLRDPMDCSLPGSSVHGIFQARVLERGAIAFSKDDPTIRHILLKFSVRDTKGTLQANMSTIKDRNGTDLTEAEDTMKRWQEYTEELCKKDLHDPDSHSGVIPRAKHPGIRSQVP